MKVYINYDDIVQWQSQLHYEVALEYNLQINSILENVVEVYKTKQYDPVNSDGSLIFILGPRSRWNLGPIASIRLDEFRESKNHEDWYPSTLAYDLFCLLSNTVHILCNRKSNVKKYFFISSCLECQGYVNCLSEGVDIHV